MLESQFKKFLLVDNGILDFGIRNSAQGTSLPALRDRARGQNWTIHTLPPFHLRAKILRAFASR